MFYNPLDDQVTMERAPVVARYALVLLRVSGLFSLSTQGILCSLKAGLSYLAGMGRIIGNES